MPPERAELRGIMLEDGAPVSRLSIDRIFLLTKIARMYHEQNMRQSDIAGRLHISQSRVSRFLREAVTLGVVRTIVVAPPGVYSELEDRLRDRFGLTDVVVAGSPSADDASVLAALGSAGAAYLETTLSRGDRVGISSWSDTLLAVVDAMNPRTTRSADVIVQILGGVGNPAAQVRATHLTDRLARVTGAGSQYFPAPGIVSSQTVRDALLKDPYIGDVAASWNSLSVALVGIGSLEASPLLKSSGNAVGGEDLQLLTRAGAVGDVCLQFFDEAGRPLDTGLAGRVLGISHEQLAVVPRIIGVAGGTQKRAAIRAAALGGWVNILITDFDTATALLSE